MSSSFNLIIKNGNCFTDGQLKKADIGISNGIVKKIGKLEHSNQKVLDATNLTILPGIIDTQVHFREPGSTDVEDLESGSKAAVLLSVIFSISLVTIFWRKDLASSPFIFTKPLSSRTVVSFISIFANIHTIIY